MNKMFKKVLSVVVLGSLIIGTQSYGYLSAVTKKKVVSNSKVSNVKNKRYTLYLDFNKNDKRVGTYTGQLKNGVPNGQGSFTTFTASNVKYTHTGNWVNGHMYGKGKRVYADGRVAEGEFKNDLFDGNVKYTQNGVVISEGEYKKDELSQGKCILGALKYYTKNDTLENFYSYANPLYDNKGQLVNVAIKVRNQNYSVPSSIKFTMDNLHGIYEDSAGKVRYILNKRYYRLDLKLALDDVSDDKYLEDSSCFVEFMDENGTNLASYNLHKGEQPIEVSLNVSNVNDLYIYASNAVTHFAKIDLIDAYLYK